MASPPGPSTPSVASPPGSRTSSPARSLRTRMGTMMRRTSTGLGLGKSNSLLRSTSKNSLRVDSTLASSSSPEHTVPSPVFESPAREAAAEDPPVIVAPQPALGPSPLSEATSAPADSSVQSTPAPAPAPALEPIEVTTSPEAMELPRSSSPDPLPAVDSSSQPAVAPETSTSPPQIQSEPVRAEQSDVAEEVVAAPSANETVVLVASGSGSVDVVPAATVTDIPGSPPSMPAGPQEPTIEKKGPDYFAWSDERALAPSWSRSSMDKEEREQKSSVPEVIAAVSHGSTQPVRGRTNDAEAYAWGMDISISPKQSVSSLGTGSVRPNEPPQPLRSGRASTRGSRSSMASSYGHVVISTAGKNVNVSMDPSDGDVRRGRSPGPSVRISMDDPFADPPEETQPIPIPKAKALSPIESIDTPLPERTRDPAWTAPITFPLPPQRDVIGPRSLRDAPSAYSLGEGPAMADPAEVPRDTDERLPLLHRPASAGFHGNGKSNTLKDMFSSEAVPFPTGQLSPEPAAAHSIERLGWTEHTLPDSSFYYSHASMRVVTDVDLRNVKKLKAVTEYLQKKLPEDIRLPTQGWELWLRDAATGRQDFRPVRNWVNHKARILTFDLPPTLVGDAQHDQVTDDDRLDMEYRYWTFLETHPAHAPLLPESRAEALDALTWSYTDSLLPSATPVPAPFTPQECQELMGLLRQLDGGSKSASVAQTRVVARVLVRVAQWRQYHYRPNKPLPRDAAKGLRRSQRRTPFGRAVADFLISCLCLGIPWLFVDRSRRQRIDEESGIRSAGPMLMIGACACLVAAVILSASVTLISLPGLDDISRLAGLLAILFSASSMVSAVIALFRYKADVERTVVHVGGEGLTLLSRRSVVMSLPLVFLAWGIAAFITGITFYSFRGATMTGRNAIRHPFEDYTHWTVVGTVGGLAGLLLVSALLARR